MWKAEYEVRIKSVVSYDFIATVDADCLEQAQNKAEQAYWNNEYHRKQYNSQDHIDFEVVNVKEVVAENDSLDDDDDFPPREDV